MTAAVEELATGPLLGGGRHLSRHLELQIMSSDLKPPATLTAEEAAVEYFRTSRSAVWKMVQRRLAPCVIPRRPGQRRILFSRPCLVKWASESDVPPPTMR